MIVSLAGLLTAVVVLEPSPVRWSARHPRYSSRHMVIFASSLWANDGGSDDIDWDKEAAALTKPANRYVKVLNDISVPDLIKEFAQTAPMGVQQAVRVTVAQLLGNLPSEVAESSITSTGQNIASLMFSMQMTGYMFRNAEYRRSLLESLDANDRATALPAVSGTVQVKLGEGIKAEVDAASYMAELRNEVESLRAELVAAKEEKAASGGELISYIQSLERQEAQQLTYSISQEVLDAMGHLVGSILRDLDISQGEQVTQAPTVKLRELLIWQLVSGYKLRELEARDELKDRFWDQ
mmetsp:Transcript_7178/g.12078  ORF Transcript_7178/g.12078 Transcript_7178/m.12078 type:complete len:296 (-) Transcript_7178:442-1329(-)|eukprot:CAMPEP_0119337304 /NCGR_PEP_ID=MMETSP1333-20130426/93704_1 /TAXON_ID=418940 /ORGANISM="Scyphosphaera apsteinii, Strain RCC1455" /LENGTH=295 /DNA_ID=CAMNT_0007348313 /DNA_START=24 /DNA_END=911 /DNA_ORIENTATION=-